MFEALFPNIFRFIFSQMPFRSGYNLMIRSECLYMKTYVKLMHRLLTFCLFLLIGAGSLNAQEEATDTTIYQMAESMPIFPGCDRLDSIPIRLRCTQESFMRVVYQNVQYPIAARQENIQGSVVAQFIIEKDGSITNPVIVRDIGGGCGDAVLAVLNGIGATEFRMVPATNEGKPVRFRQTIPVKFRLEEAPPYIMVEQDTVYVEYETALDFKGGGEALIDMINKDLEYPNIESDTCMIGKIQTQILVDGNGNVSILDITDFNALGTDFFMEAVETATSTSGHWIPATYEGRNVSTSYDLAFTFKPDKRASCATKIEEYNQAQVLMNEGLGLLADESTIEAGIEKMNAAVELAPYDMELRYLRGQANIDLQNLAEACEDLTLVRKISLVNWFDDILPIICWKGESDE